MPPRSVGRYLLYEAFASGGMASVHFGRMLGPAGFSRTVAIKRLHAHLAQDPEFVSMFLDEARLAARVQHPNVVATLDVVASEGEIFLVMDYVLGESWGHLMRAARRNGVDVPLRLVSAVVSGMLSGLHAAHEARTERGEPMNLVHRDVSPQNLLVGADGATRVVDFGVAKAVSRVQSTQGDKIKGKVAYMAPEQLQRRKVDRRADVYAAGVVLWEALTGRRLFTADDAPALVAAVIEAKIPPPSSLRREVSHALDAVVLRATASDADARYPTALALVEALESVLAPAPAREVAAWVSTIAGPQLEERRRLVTEVEQVGASDTSGQALHQDVEVPVAGPTTREEAEQLAAAATRSWVSPGRATSEGEEASGVERRRRRWGVWAGAAGSVAIGLGALVGVRAASSAGPTAAGSAPLPSASPVVAEARSTSDEPVAPSASPPPTASSPVPGPSIEPPVPVRPRSVHAHARPAASASTAKGCDPNFTVDADGVKRFKPWCF